jgi:DNA-binding transcriptional ArsR family regulator
MVVVQEIDERVDHLFHAVSDATRRDILRQAGVGEYSVSKLAGRYPMSFAAVQKHVAVLERAGLVIKQRRGREQIVHVNQEGLAQMQQTLDQLEALWRSRVDRMTDLLATEASNTTKGKIT